MKTSKSKSKTKARADTTINQPKKKIINRKSGKTKQLIVPLNCLKGKVLFNISNIDSTLARAIIKIINGNEQRLKINSMLLQLRLPKKTNQEITYKHDIDTKEAMSLYSHLISKQSGFVDSVQQLYQLTQMIREYNLPNNLQIPSIAQFNNKIEEMRKGIKTKYLEQRKKRVKSYLQNPMNEDNIKQNLLKNKIKELTKSLLNQAIVAIRQIQNDQVEIIFQQCYPQKRCKIQYLKHLIGQQVYNEKKISFVKCNDESGDKLKDNKNFIVCHQCKCLLVGPYARCSQEDIQQFKPSYKNSPHIYYRNLVAFDYCYHPSASVERIEQEMEYFRYYLHRKSFCCFRFTCLPCLSKQNNFNQPKDLNKYTCPFCRNVCTCKSCTLAQEILKCLALYKDILVRNDQSFDHLSELINFANLNDNQIVVEQCLRYTFSQNREKKYTDFYVKLKQQFIKIDQACNKYQQMMLGGNEFELDRNSLLPNSYIKKVRLYMIQRRQNYFNLTNNKNGNLFQRKYHLHSRYNQEQKKINQQRKQSIPPNNEFNKNQQPYNINKKSINLTLSQKINTYSIQFQNNVRFDIPNQPQYSDEKTTSLNKELLKTWQNNALSVDKSIIRNMMTVKDVLPYNQQDYDIAINVLPTNIIKKDEHLNVDSLIQHRIFYNWKDPSFSLQQNLQDWRQGKFASQCMDELQMSESDQQQSRQDSSKQYQVLPDQSSSNYEIAINMYSSVQDQNSSLPYEHKDSESLANQLNQSLEPYNQDCQQKENQVIQLEKPKELKILQRQTFMIKVEEKLVENKDQKQKEAYRVISVDAQLVENKQQVLLVENQSNQNQEEVIQIDESMFRRYQKE